jgi:ribosomal protein L24
MKKKEKETNQKETEKKIVEMVRNILYSNVRSTRQTYGRKMGNVTFIFFLH